MGPSHSSPMHTYIWDYVPPPFLNDGNKVEQRKKQGNGLKTTTMISTNSANECKNIFVAHLSMRSARNTMAEGGPQSDTRDFWRHWWDGPSDPSVGEGPWHWKRLPPTETRMHKGKAISYA